MAFDFPPGTEGLEFTPISGLTYVYKTNRWVVKSSFNPMSVLVVADAPPASPAHGQLWWESDSGNLFIWYNDGTSSQWVQVNVPSDFTLASNFVQKAGDTMTGPLGINHAATFALTLNKTDASKPNNILGQSLGVNRWFLTLGNNIAESGGDVGSDFSIYRYDDAGLNSAIALYITRSTKAVGLYGMLNLSGPGGGQIAFPTTQNPSSNAYILDDYHEGSWVPAFSAPGSTFAYAARNGFYTKVGQLVFCNLSIKLATSGNTLAAGALTITGLPFTPVNQSVISLVNWWQTVTALVSASGRISAGSGIELFAIAAAAAANMSSMQATALSPTLGTQIDMTFCYQAT